MWLFATVLYGSETKVDKKKISIIKAVEIKFLTSAKIKNESTY